MIATDSAMASRRISDDWNCFIPSWRAASSLWFAVTALTR